MDRYFLQSELLGRLPSRMTDDDDAIGVDDDRLLETKLLDRPGHGVDGLVIDARIAIVGPDFGQLALFNLHGVNQ